MFRTVLENYLELGRVSNLPTCLTNVLVGCSIDAVSHRLAWGRLFVVAVAVSLLYVGGMVMNDLFDEPFDRKQRPNRPLPSGRIRRSSAMVFLGVCLLGGMGILFWLGGPVVYLGLLLLGLITLYNLTHKRFSFAFVLMGGCRATIYAISAASVMWPPAWWFVIGFGSTLFFYTSMITVIARSENSELPGRQRFLSWVMPVLFVPPLFLPSYLNIPLILAGLLPGGLWAFRGVRLLYRSPPQTQDAIHTWISGICLLDAFFLALLNQPIPFALALACFALTHWGHRRISGT